MTNKKFSKIVSSRALSESTDMGKVQSAVEVLLNKMGYESIEELQREKSLISKLENLLKEINPKHNISEDEAEDIEDKTVKMGKPKKLKTELTEDEAEDIEDATVKMGKPKKLKTELTEDKAEEIEKEVLSRGSVLDKSVEVEDDLELTLTGKKVKSKGTSMPSSKKILSFQEFVGESKTKSFYSRVNEAEIKSDEEFKEYVSTMLKKAFGDKFDQAKADEVADGLIKKYEGDYGAMVGALQSSMGS